MKLCNAYTTEYFKRQNKCSRGSFQ